MIVQFVIHIIGNSGFAFDLKTSGRATRHARAQFFRSVITSFWYIEVMGRCCFHTNSVFTPWMWQQITGPRQQAVLRVP
jgi:hypothetical protein